MRFKIPYSGETFAIEDSWWTFCESEAVEAIFKCFPSSEAESCVPICRIRPPKRADGIVPFKKYKLASILCAFNSPECNLPPVDVKHIAGDPQYSFEVINGYHRYYASLAVGFTELPIRIVGQAKQEFIPMPFFDVLLDLGLSNFGNPHSFKIGTLFWRLQRLLGSYERILMAVDGLGSRDYLDADLEDYFMRFRIALNDVAYIIWQLIPSKAQGIKGPRGNRHPLNREVSINDLQISLKKESNQFPELNECLQSVWPWIDSMRTGRDNLAHYKAQAVIIEKEVLHFCLVNAANDQATTVSPEGHISLVTEPIAPFVRQRTSQLFHFLNTSLYEAIQHHARRHNLAANGMHPSTQMTCPGAARFLANKAAAE